MTLVFLISTLCLTLCFHQVALALKGELNIQRSGPFGLFVMQDFGMATGGLVAYNYETSLPSTNNSPDYYLLLLVLTEQQLSGWYSAISESEAAIENSIEQLCYQPSYYRRQLGTSGNGTFVIANSIGSDRFSVLVLQCRAGNPNDPLNLAVKVSLLNPQPTGSKYSHFSIQSVLLPRITEGALIVYCLLMLGIVGQIYIAPNYVSYLHWLFVGTLFAVILAYFVQYFGEECCYIHADTDEVSANFMIRTCFTANSVYESNGEENVSIDITARVFALVADALILLSLLLLSLGWSLVRTTLTRKETIMIAGIIGLYFVFGMGAAVCIDPGEVRIMLFTMTTCDALSLVAFIIKSLLFLAIIIAMNFTVTQLRAMLAHSPWVPSTPIQYARAKQFQLFRVLFIIYLLLPTAFLIIQVTIYSWRETWMRTLLLETLQLLMFFHVGVNFGPLNEPMLVRAFDGSLNANTNTAVAAHSD